MKLLDIYLIYVSINYNDECFFKIIYLFLFIFVWIIKVLIMNFLFKLIVVELIEWLLEMFLLNIWFLLRLFNVRLVGKNIKSIFL